ncbi:MAG TPA: hypothetical protein VGC86_00395 [Afipia sp.]
MGANRRRKIRSRTKTCSRKKKAPAIEIARGLELIGYHDTPMAFKHRFSRRGGGYGLRAHVYWKACLFGKSGKPASEACQIPEKLPKKPTFTAVTGYFA